MSNNPDSINDWLDSLQESEFIPLSQRKIRLNTPFTDSFSDQISLLILLNDDSTYTITDQGYTLWNIESRGISLTQDKSPNLDSIKSILNTNQTQLSDTFEIYKKVPSSNDIPAIKDVLISIIEISNLSLS